MRHRSTVQSHISCQSIWSQDSFCTDSNQIPGAHYQRIDCIPGCTTAATPLGPLTAKGVADSALRERELVAFDESLQRLAGASLPAVIACGAIDGSHMVRFGFRDRSDCFRGCFECPVQAGALLLSLQGRSVKLCSLNCWHACRWQSRP